jgi:hypothetical protein
MATASVAWGQDIPTPAVGKDGSVALRTYAVTTQRRSLTKLPVKALITDDAGWKHVTTALEGAPPKPNFAEGQVCAIVVANVAGGADAELNVARAGETEGELWVAVTRKEETRKGQLPGLKAIFLVVAASFTKIHLDFTTELLGGAGRVTRGFPPVESDAVVRQLPRLGPDLRLSVEMADGSAVPDGLKLRYEASYPKSDNRPGKIETIEFPHKGLPFPRIRDDVRHVYAAHGAGLRSKNPLVVRKLPRAGADGSPLPIRHRFVLEKTGEK